MVTKEIENREYVLLWVLSDGIFPDGCIDTMDYYEVTKSDIPLIIKDIDKES